LRQRRDRRIRKRLRGGVARAVAGRERRGESLEAALCGVLTDGALSQWDRAEAGRLLSIGVDGRAVRELVAQFLRQEGKDELYMTAMALEELDDARAVPALIRALLGDGNEHRRNAAARALGWISRPGKEAARALALCLADPGQPQAAREEAAESLAYVGNAETVEALIAALSDGDVRIRFWAVFGLGGSCRGEARAVRALEGGLG
jgi:HEAT repeat protein